MPTLTKPESTELHIRLKTPHPHQIEFIESTAKRKIIRAGRRAGKTIGAAILAVREFLKGKRVLYTSPTTEQVESFWREVSRSLVDAINAGVFRKNETEHCIELPNTESRIRCKTVWSPDMLRGDYGDLIIFDEWQLCNEQSWETVGHPMLLDNNGDAVFIYTPPSLHSTGVTRATDPRHASKMFAKALADKSGRWAAFSFASMDNPYISPQALTAITADMSLDAYRREILAQDEEIESSWLVYSKFDPRVCKIPRFPIPKEWLIYSGHDFGSANPAALFLAGNPATREFFVFKEYAPGGGRSAVQHVEEFRKLTGSYNVIRRVGGNVTTEDEIRQAYTAQGWVITAPNVTKVNAQIDRVRGLMELNKIFVFEDCVMLLSELANCLWKLGTDGKPTNDIQDEKRYHLLAALRYIGSEFLPENIAVRKKFPIKVLGR